MMMIITILRSLVFFIIIKLQHLTLSPFYLFIEFYDSKSKRYRLVKSNYNIKNDFLFLCAFLF